MRHPSLSKRSLAIDYGKARLGVAISDSMKIIASPLLDIQAKKEMEKTVENVLEEIKRLEEKSQLIDEVIVGMPLKMNGKASQMSLEVHAFVDLLRSKSSLTIKTWDERLTSAQADRSMREAKMNRKKRAQSVDGIAAVLILQSYLDSRKYSTYNF